METGIAPIAAHRATGSMVQWGASIAGAFVATAIGVILLTFGTALGLTVTSPFEGEGLEPVAFAVMAGLYFLWVQVMSFYCGGYVAGRMSRREADTSEHEADVRDGMHGLIAWAVGVVAAALLAFLTVTTASDSTRAQRNDVAASVTRVVDEQVDEAVAQQAAEVAPSATAAEHRAEIARKLTVISAFVTAVSLLVGAVAAFYGAHSGGNHRDKNIVWGFFTSYVRPKRVPPIKPTGV